MKKPTDARRPLDAARRTDVFPTSRPAPSPAPRQRRPLTVRQAIQLGMKHHSAGDLPTAESIYRQVLEAEPKQPDALHLLGTIAHQVGRNDVAVELIGEAVAIKPDYPEAHNNLGAALLELGRVDEAVASYEQALEIAPDRAETHNNLGNALKEQENLEQAVESYQQALALNPDFAEAHFNLGNTFKDQWQLEDAAASYRDALAARPKFAEAQSSLAYVLQELGRLDEAIALYRDALTHAPGSADIHGSLAIALNMAGRRDEAMAAFEAGFAIRRASETVASDDIAFRRTNRAKMAHDVEQFEYLAGHGTGAETFGDLAEKYRRLMAEIDWPENDAENVMLDDDQLARLGHTYNRPIHRVAAPGVPGSTLGPDLDVDAITAAYFGHAHGMTYFDGLLSPEALAALRRYLLESTIWYDCHYGGGYLGAMLHDGLACPLLLQIADDLCRTFPAIFKDHKLRQLWAYKYDSRLTGIATHADFAAVNVNFWITPDDANLNPASGGLIVHDAKAPMDWDFKTYNTDQDRIHAYLADNDSGEVVVPHRQNRMVLFNSDLFHATDTIDFKEGYENRRINVTMLFGHRGD